MPAYLPLGSGRWAAQRCACNRRRLQLLLPASMLAPCCFNLFLMPATVILMVMGGGRRVAGSRNGNHFLQHPWRLNTVGRRGEGQMAGRTSVHLHRRIHLLLLHLKLCMRGDSARRLDGSSMELVMFLSRMSSRRSPSKFAHRSGSDLIAPCSIS